MKKARHAPAIHIWRWLMPSAFVTAARNAMRNMERALIGNSRKLDGLLSPTILDVKTGVRTSPPDARRQQNAGTRWQPWATIPMAGLDMPAYAITHTTEDGSC